jgi:hypothetical protein
MLTILLLLRLKILSIMLTTVLVPRKLLLILLLVLVPRKLMFILCMVSKESE